MNFLGDKKFTKKNNLNGFTLIEVVLVLFVVSSTFTGIYAVLSKNSRNDKDNRYSLIASNLAQEGAEMIRNKRDENLLNGHDIDYSFSSGRCYPYQDGSEFKCDDIGRVEEVEISSEVYKNCSSSACSSASAKTVFRRFCDIVPDDEIMQIECTVEWRSPSLGIDKNITVESILTDWQKNN